MYKQLRILLIVSVLVTIAGCGVFGAKFDNNEYAAYARLQSQTTIAQDHCGDFDELRLDINKMNEQVEFLHVYTKHLDSNAESYNIALILRRNVKELKTAYDGQNKSEAYCTFKLRLLSEAIENALEAVTTKVK